MSITFERPLPRAAQKHVSTEQPRSTTQSTSFGGDLIRQSAKRQRIEGLRGDLDHTADILPFQAVELSPPIEQDVQVTVADDTSGPYNTPEQIELHLATGELAPGRHSRQMRLGETALSRISSATSLMSELSNAGARAVKSKASDFKEYIANPPTPTHRKIGRYTLATFFKNGSEIEAKHKLLRFAGGKHRQSTTPAGKHKS